MWIFLSNGVLKNIDLYSFIPSDDGVAMEHELRDGHNAKRIAIAHADSLSEAQRIVDDLAEQIADGKQLLRVPSRACASEVMTELDDDPFFDYGDPVG